VSSTSVVIRAAERALASASVIAVKIDAIAPSGVGALHARRGQLLRRHRSAFRCEQHRGV
jgi:hypothetical protein